MYECLCEKACLFMFVCLYVCQAESKLNILNTILITVKREDWLSLAERINDTTRSSNFFVSLLKYVIQICYKCVNQMYFLAVL